MVFWHELTVDERKAVRASGITVQEFVEKYQVPQWCNDPDMIDPIWGCWSLCSNHSVSQAFCDGCECFVPTFDVIEVNWHTTLVTKIHLVGVNLNYANNYRGIYVAQKDHFFAIVVHGTYKLGVTYVDNTVEKK